MRELTLEQAAGLARDAACVALGGWSFSRRPVAVAAALIGAGVCCDELLVLTGGIETDLLVAAGAVRRVRAFYLGMEVLGSGPGLRGPVEVLEETESSLILGLRAAVDHQPSFPLPRDQCEALLALRPDLAVRACPYSGHEQIMLPAIKPDLCFIHAAKADRRGRASWRGHRGADALLSRAATCTVVTCEELVDRLDPGSDPVMLDDLQIDAVVPCPGGAWPTACLPAYAADWPALIDYAGTAREDVRSWIERRAAARGAVP